jgi:hypothetical protein
LRARRQHKLADSDWVWLGTRGRGRFANTGIRKVLLRRAEQAGYLGVTDVANQRALEAKRRKGDMF